jgi:hypothetical protein
MLSRPGAKEPATLAASAIDPVIAAAPGGAAPVVAAWESTGRERGIAVRVLATKH